LALAVYLFSKGYAIRRPNRTPGLEGEEREREDEEILEAYNTGRMVRYPDILEELASKGIQVPEFVS
jgi:hypothetical protein